MAKDRIYQYLIYIAMIAFLAIGIIEPLRLLIFKSFHDANNQFIGLMNIQKFISEPRLIKALLNSLWVSTIVAMINLVIATSIAYSVSRLNIKGRTLIQIICVFPLYIPSIFPALGLIYLFGSQGILSQYLDGFELYGLLGVVVGCLIFTLPHAVLMMSTAMKGIDIQLYKAADSLAATEWIKFFKITIPSIKYGLMNTFIVIFILTLTDFGVPKILGGQIPLLATEIYKEVIGQQNFSMGATLSLLLLFPVLIAACLDYVIRRKQKAIGEVNHTQNYGFSWAQKLIFSVISWAVALSVLLVLGIVIYGSFINFWPFDLTFTLENYNFRSLGYDWQPYFNSLRLALYVGLLGVLLAFSASYLVNRANIHTKAKNLLSFIALLPMAIPGTVLGLAYIFMVNAWPSIGNSVRNSFVLLTTNTTIHLFSVIFLTFSIHLSRLPIQYEKTSDSLGRSRFITIQKVIIPLSMPIIVEVFFFLAINAMTTISAVIFLYNPDTILASITILHMEESGALASSAAMGTLIFATCLVFRVIQLFIQRYIYEK